MTYKVTFQEERRFRGSWSNFARVEVIPLSLDLEVDDGVGNCCAVGYISNFFTDGDFKRHPADHHYVTVEAIKGGCKDLVEASCSLAYATINTSQRLTEAALLEAGFVCPTEGWAYRNPKYSHTDTGVKVFVKPLFKVFKRKPRKEK